MDINWNAPVTGAYCERLSADFWAEPLNAITSLLVVCFGLIGTAYLIRKRRMTPVVTLLMVLSIAIGAGSFLFHTYATRWAELADVLPIWAFVVVYSLAVIRHFSLKAAPHPALTILLGAAIFTAGTGLSMADTLLRRDDLSGSTQYLPAILMILAIIRLLWQEKPPSFHLIGSAVALFALALVFRSLDLHACSIFPSGTHFLWHLTNSAVFGLLIWALVEREIEEAAGTDPMDGR
jgi:hypothetical protein